MLTHQQVQKVLNKQFYVLSKTQRLSLASVHYLTQTHSKHSLLKQQVVTAQL